jgi:glycosyltransferase involved in cell wall biosynthesis
MQPLVSIVVPAYNNASFIDETLCSIRAQTYEDLEIIVADHSSTDETLAIIKRHADDPRLIVLNTPAGGGAARNWNRVSKEAAGEYLKLVCGDDLLHPTIVQQQVNALVSTPSAVLAASPRRIIDATGRVVIRKRGLAGLAGAHTGPTSIRRTVRSGTNVFGEPASVLIHRPTFVDAGMWDTAESYLIDEASYIRVLLRGGFVGVDTSLATFRISSDQWSVRLVGEQSAQTIAFHAKLAAEYPSIVRPIDQWIGNVRARSSAVARRAVYGLLGSRMRAPA